MYLSLHFSADNISITFGLNLTLKTIQLICIRQHFRNILENINVIFVLKVKEYTSCLWEAQHLVLKS